MKKDKEREIKFENKYRISSTRLLGWDYRKRACYFITICTKNMSASFGYVEKNKMILSDLGLFVEHSIVGIKMYKEEVKIINHVVMPNHIHLLIYLKNKTNTVENSSFGPLLSNSLSSLINHFKGRVTRYAKGNSLPWEGWHERFHDHIVRDEASYNKINQYISSNPQKWKADKYFV